MWIFSASAEVNLIKLSAYSLIMQYTSSIIRETAILDIRLESPNAEKTTSSVKCPEMKHL